MAPSEGPELFAFSFSGSMTVGFPAVNKHHIPGFQIKPLSFINQFSIPIFNHFSTRNKIRTAKIDRENQMLRLENTKKDLYKEIQQVYYNAVASLCKYTSSLEAKKSNDDAFELTKAKYENGKATLTEFNEQKNNLLKAESDLVQAKYEYLYQTSLLDFYRGRQLTF